MSRNDFDSTEDRSSSPVSPRRSLSDLIDIIGALLAPWLALTIPALLDLCAGLSMKAYPMTPVDVSVASFVLTTSFILAICGTTSVIMAL
jgi:hypothetical protein